MSPVAFLQIIQLKVSFSFGLVTLSSTDNLTGPLQIQYSGPQLPLALLYTVYSSCPVSQSQYSNWFGWLLLHTVLFANKMRWADIPSLVCKIMIMGGGVTRGLDSCRFYNFTMGQPTGLQAKKKIIYTYK